MYSSTTPQRYRLAVRVDRCFGRAVQVEQLGMGQRGMALLGAGRGERFAATVNAQIDNPSNLPKRQYEQLSPLHCA